MEVEMFFYVDRGFESINGGIFGVSNDGGFIKYDCFIYGGSLGICGGCGVFFRSCRE